MKHHYDDFARGDVSDTRFNKNESAFSVTPLIHRAVFVNNKATKLVREHRYDAAVKSFTSVLQLLKPLAVMVEGSDIESSNNTNVNHEPVEKDANDSIPAPLSSSSTRRRDSRDGCDRDENIEMMNSHQETESADLEAASEQEQSRLPFSESYCNGEHPRRRSSLGSLPSTSSRGKIQRRHSETSSTTISSSPSPSSVSPSCTSRSTSTPASIGASTPASPSFSESKPSHFVFRDLVEIPPESVPSRIVMADNGGASTLFSKFLMILMYNLALTLHLHAISIGNDCSSYDKELNTTNISNDADVSRPSSTPIPDQKKSMKLFLRARKLYELAFEMHLDESCNVSLLFTLALINNLGLVYDMVGEKRRSQTCFKNMFSTMMYLVDSNESQAIEEWDGLLSNVMEILFKEQCEIAAPAA